MLYYKVKPSADQIKREPGTIYIADELYTQKEIERYNLQLKYLDPVEIKRTETFWSFGARFGIDRR